jgi:hypothetical protein
MSQMKKDFLTAAFLSLTLMATLRRSKTYREGVNEADRARLKDTLRKRLTELAQQYTISVGEDRHIENIQHLSNDLSKEFALILEEGRFRIGSAQKALNLYLKYLWCAEQIPAPPHCPFDSVIIDQLDDCDHINWTDLKDIEDYNRLVAAARAKARNTPLAQWELEIYNRAWG